METIDVYNDPYSRRRTARIKRSEFNKLKTTQAFKGWRTRQLKIQEGKCAYCKIDLSGDNIVTHVDHVQPLYFDGANSFDNFVLTCKRCNMKKWIDDRYVIPQWIKDNDAKYRRKQQLDMARQKQKAQIKEILDENLLEELGFLD